MKSSSARPPTLIASAELLWVCVEEITMIRPLFCFSTNHSAFGANGNISLFRNVNQWVFQARTGVVGNSDLSGAEAEAEDDESFSMINSDSSNCLCLFARADREKEEWYRRFAEAVRPHGGGPHGDSRHDASHPPTEIDDGTPFTPALAVATLTDYFRYMQSFQLEVTTTIMIRSCAVSISDGRTKSSDFFFVC